MVEVTVLYVVDLSHFKDSGGDGRGTFKGSTDKLDYIAGLGATRLWLLPFELTTDADTSSHCHPWFSTRPAAAF